MPSNFCKDVFVQYQLYLEETKYQTNVVPGKHREPEFNYRRQHTQTVVTENFLKYIKNEVMAFKVFGFPDVKTEKMVENLAASKKKQKSQAAAAAAMKQ